MVWLTSAVVVRSVPQKPSCSNESPGLGRTPACISAPTDAFESASAPRNAGLLRAAMSSASASVNGGEEAAVAASPGGA